MKLQNYLIEDNKSLAYYTKKIQAECKPFLKEIKGARGTLTRHQKAPNPGGGGSIKVKKVNTTPVFKKTTRKDRQPLDSPFDFHILIDDWFANSKFGWRARSSALFCWGTPFPLLASDWMVFPAGKFQYVWSPKVTDLYGKVEIFFEKGKGEKRKAEQESDGPKSFGDPYMDRATDEAWEVFEKQLAPTYTNKNLKKAVVSSKEIMVNCSYSYLVRQELIENVNDLLDLRLQGAKFVGRKL
jgi:hypothetical protein